MKRELRGEPSFEVRNTQDELLQATTEQLRYCLPAKRSSNLGTL